MKTFDEVISDIKDEFKHQDSKYLNNSLKPFEIWLLLTRQWTDDAIERYGHSTQQESRQKLLKAVTCGIRALMGDSAKY